ncbi:MAG: GNAT family N-acetyltransferase [Candidatus Hodarchaeota archaeon]
MHVYLILLRWLSIIYILPWCISCFFVKVPTLEFEKAEFYSYTSEGKIVAVSALEIENDKIGKINWLYVLPYWQRKGIGTTLINYLEKKAKKIGLRTLRLITIEKAIVAVSFYTKLGYQTIRIKRNWDFDILMKKCFRKFNSRT